MKWATHGVLLLNTCLTVEEGQPASHAGRGWEVLTDAVIRHVAQGERPVVFMLWGAHAQSKRALIDMQRHKVLVANHPSPLSALRPPLPFIGCGHFGAGAGLAGRRKRDRLKCSIVREFGSRAVSRDRDGAAIRSSRNSCYIPRFAGEVAEWLMAADCKSALLRVRWFESSPLHQR